MRFLTIDCGTQSLRAFVIDEKGHLLARSQIAFAPPYHAPQVGWAEQSAEFYWQTLVTACQQLWQQGIDPITIHAVALTTQRGSVVVVDKAGQPLRPTMLWLDEREAASLPTLPVHWQKLHQISGHQATIERLRRRAPANWLAIHEPAIWAKTHKFLLLSGYLTWQLTGQYKDAIPAQVGYIPFDYKKHQWCAGWDWRWQALGLTPAQLPELVPAGKLLGYIHVKAATLLGLAAGVPVIAAGADKACEVLGAGCLSSWQGALSFGTTATYNTVSRRYLSINPPLPAYPAAVPNQFCLESQIPQGFALVSYFRDQIAHAELALEAEQGRDWLTVLEQWLQQSPAGANGLLWQPSLSVQTAGESVSRGAILGLHSQHTKADWYRALVEGLLYSLRDGMHHVARYTRQPILELMAAGGGSQSDAVMQTAADIFGLPVHRMHTHETSGLGAAMCAAVGMGVYPNFSAAVQGMNRIEQTFKPNAQRSEWYDRCYHHLYRPWLTSLAHLYRRERLYL